MRDRLVRSLSSGVSCLCEPSWASMPLNKRLHPPLVFARFDLGSDTLKVRFAINHSFRSTGTHIVHQLVIALLFEHGRNRAIVKKDFPEGHSPILPFRHKNLAQD